MAKFITIAGSKQVGKDTSAKMIEDLLYENNSFANVHLVAFADALKQACNIIFGIPLEDMETEEGKQKLTNIPWPTELFDQEDCVEILGYMSYDKYVAKWAEYNNARRSRNPDYVDIIPNDPRFMTVREVLQFVGTDLFRNQLDPDVWVKSVFIKQYNDDDLVVISDCRFPNEAKLGREYGVLIKIERQTGLQDDSHASEKALDDYNDYDYVIDNNGSFDDLRGQLSVILRERDLL